MSFLLCRVQSNFESNPQSWIYETELFKLYQAKFVAHGPMLRSADLVTVSRVGFPKMETVFVQEQEGAPPVQIIKGISKKAWIDFSGGRALFIFIFAPKDYCINWIHMLESFELTLIDISLFFTHS